MSEPMDNQAKSLIAKMRHHLTHEYSSTENRQLVIDAHYKEFKYYESIPVTNFSPSVWDEMNDLFN